MKFVFFHLMPYPYLERMPGNWPVPHKLFEPERASVDYQRYLDQMALGDDLGFDWVDITGVSTYSLGSPGWIASDQLHPGDAQYAAWAEVIWDRVRDAWARASRPLSV